MTCIRYGNIDAILLRRLSFTRTICKMDNIHSQQKSTPCHDCYRWQMQSVNMKWTHWSFTKNRLISILRTKWYYAPIRPTLFSENVPTRTYYIRKVHCRLTKNRDHDRHKCPGNGPHRTYSQRYICVTSNGLKLYTNDCKITEIYSRPNHIQRLFHNHEKILFVFEAWLLAIRQDSSKCCNIIMF